MEPFINVAAFVVFAVLWLAFGLALVANRGSLDATWEWIGSMPLIVQGICWLLFLPVVAGLWVWETAWPELVRLALVGGLAAVTLYLFFPRTLFGGRL